MKYKYIILNQLYSSLMKNSLELLNKIKRHVKVINVFLLLLDSNEIEHLSYMYIYKQ
jgi:hypothetical protein